MRLPLDNHPEWRTLPQYFAGELGEPEAARLRAWIDADADRAAAVAELRVVWEAVGTRRHTWDAAAALQRIRRLGAEPVEILPRRSREPARDVDPFRSRPWWKPNVAAVAAAALLVAVAGGWQLSRYGGLLPGHTAALMMTELVTRRGQRADLLLPDGSRVMLGVGSRLRYPARYAGASRDLYLDGEAYFQVVHDATKPFRVHTDRGVAEDLGTAFGIRAYGAGELDVVVAEGAVVLRNAGHSPAVSDSVVLTHADLGHVDAEGRVSRTSNVDLDEYLAWRQGKLVFHDTPVREVLRRLGQWYDVDLELADSTIADRPFTASFDNEPVDRVLDVLALTMHLRYERRGMLRLVFAR